MSPVSPWAAVAVLLAASATAAFLPRLGGGASGAGRYATIDGLRGYSAIFVFLHHGSIWYFHARTGQWTVPPSRLFTHFGQSGVALFFMITGFLFATKLLDSRGRPIDWTRLYVSRILRLVPLYAFAMAAFLMIVFHVSGWELRQPLWPLLKGIGSWLAFTIPGAPELNGIAGTGIIVAGVTWSLPYEWFFYLSLPILGIALRVKPSTPFLLLSLAAMAGAAAWRPGIMQAALFGGGIVAALAARRQGFRSIAAAPIGTGLVLASVAVLVWAFPTAYAVVPVILLTAAFSLIAGGCSLFGVLASRASRALGDIAYSLYMLHGMALYLLFQLAIGPKALASLSPEAHWLIVIGLTPILTATCFLTFRLIEWPAMRSATRVMSWIRSAPGAGAADEAEAAKATPS